MSIDRDKPHRLAYSYFMHRKIYHDIVVIPTALRISTPGPISTQLLIEKKTPITDNMTHTSTNINTNNIIHNNTSKYK